MLASTTLILSASCTTILIDTKPRIAVSIVPQETFIKAVAGNLVHVITMIPPGCSPANYQPTPLQMVEFSKADIYFSMGVPSEEASILPKVKELNKNIKIVSLAEKAAATYPYLYSTEINSDNQSDSEQIEKNYHHTGRDPHVWLSPKRVMIMIDAIKDELILLDPTNKLIYEKNASDYISQLEHLDSTIASNLSSLKQKSFIIYHPAFGYFADDYGLNMVSIEKNGKETSAKRIQTVIDYAKKEKIKIVFYQEEFDGHQAEIIATEIKGATIKVTPLSPDYIDNLKSISDTFKKVME